MKVSETTDAICDEHFDDDCVGCPLQKECESPIKRGGLPQWVNEINNRAEFVMEGEKR